MENWSGHSQRTMFEERCLNATVPIGEITWSYARKMCNLLKDAAGET